MPEPDLNSLSHRLIDAAVLEFGPTEIFLPVDAMHRAIPVSADRAAPAGPHTRAKSRLLAVGGQNRARRGLSTGEEWIRTLRSAILIMLRKTGLFETGQCTTEQGVAWGSGVARAFVKATGR